MIEPFETDDPRDRRLALGMTGLLGHFNAAGVIEAADAHTARRVQVLAAETDDEVALALALTVRSLRHGSVCLDPRRPSPRGACPDGLSWPEPAAGRRSGSARFRLRGGRCAAGRGEHRLPRPLLARGVPGARRPCGSARPRTTPWWTRARSRRTLAPVLVPGSRVRRVRAARRAARPGADSGPPSSPAAPAPARPPPSPVCSPCSPTSPTDACGSRSRRRRARPPRGCRRRFARRWPSRTSPTTLPRSVTRRRRRSTGSWAGSAAAATGSATTAATGCRTT